MSMHGDLEEAVQMLAADNARLCDIALKADALAKAVEGVAYIRSTMPNLWATLSRALDEYKITRQGQ